jgi:hypothetical protein
MDDVFELNHAFSLNALDNNDGKHSLKTAGPYFSGKIAGDRALLELRTVLCADALP